MHQPFYYVFIMIEELKALTLDYQYQKTLH